MILLVSFVYAIHIGTGPLDTDATFCDRPTSNDPTEASCSGTLNSDAGDEVRVNDSTSFTIQGGDDDYITVVTRNTTVNNCQSINSLIAHCIHTEFQSNRGGRVGITYSLDDGSSWAAIDYETGTDNTIEHEHTLTISDATCSNNEIVIRCAGQDTDGGSGPRIDIDQIYFVLDYVEDTTKPRINASIFNVSAPTKGDVVNFTANVSDNAFLDTCQFFMNGTSDGSFIILNKTVTGTDDQCSQNWTIDLIRGNVINFTTVINDSNNNINQSEQIITVANFIPTPTIVFPTNDLKTNLQPLHLNVTFEPDRDNDVINISYYIDGKLNQTQLGLNTTFNASDGIYILNVTLFDNVTATSYSANVTVNFTIDTVKPNVTLISPADIFNSSSKNITFKFNVTDERSTQNINCSIYIDAVLNATNSSTLNGTTTSFKINNFNEGAFFWNVTCLDEAGNSNTSIVRNFTIDLSVPLINKISFSPNSTDDVDPDVLLNFTVNVTEDTSVTNNVSEVKTVVLQYKQSGAGTLKIEAFILGFVVSST